MPAADADLGRYASDVETSASQLSATLYAGDLHAQLGCLDR